MKTFEKIFLGFATLTLVACGGQEKSSNQSHLSGNIKIDGSSTVYPITEAVAEEFRNVQPNINVTVGVSGTGGGFKKFMRGEIDINIILCVIQSIYLCTVLVALAIDSYL